MIGTTLQQRYRIDTRLGQGGMGAVFSAYDQRLERNVAIKVLSNDQLGTEGRAQLLQEARAVARLNHPNIVSVYDADEDGSVSFVVMELVNGKTLRDQQPASMEEVVAIARQVCMALEHAHNNGIIHRDLKPENIMRVGQQVKLMDFGLARSVRDERLPESGLSGTPAYISPEQIKETPPDARSDLYSLGVLLYESATGGLPFRATSLFSLISQHLTQLPTPPKQVNPAIDSHLEAIILRLLAKDPADRYPSASAVLEELNLAFPAGSVSTRPLTRQRHNLPAETTTFVGRQKEAAEILDHIRQTRLVTLTGSGGIGKTRLSLHVAARLIDSFADGVWFAELAPISDPAMVPTAIAKIFGLNDDPERAMSDKLCEYFSERFTLLILDNCEHLMDACAALSEQLLRASPRLKILASSREALGITGEVSYRVPSLSLPGGAQDLEQSEAARMFIERAHAISPGFALTPQNSEVIAQICRRLDGIPLALELAAARVNMLKVEQIATRLDDRFRLLTGGSRTALPRQQTLRALIDWSWDLLSLPERALLRGVSVFAGGWSLESAEAVCAGLQVDDSTSIHPNDILDLLTQLVHKSLVLAEQDEQGEMRYRLLESIRQYAREKLWDAGQAEQLRNRHLAHFHQMALLADSQMYTRRQVYWHNRLPIEMENFRAALEWGQDRDIVAALQIVYALNRIWEKYSILDELNWLKLLLPRAEKQEVALSIRARGWLILSSEQTWTYELEEAYRYGEKSLELYRQAGDPLGESAALTNLAYFYDSAMIHDSQKSWELVNQALELSRANHDKVGELEALFTLGMIEQDYERAKSFIQQSMAICQEMGHLLGEASRLDDLAWLALRRGDYENQHAWLLQAVRKFDEAGIPNQGHLFINLGELEFRRGNYQAARQNLEIGIQMNRDKGALIMMPWSLRNLGRVLVQLNDFEAAYQSFKEALRFFEADKFSRPIVFVVCVEGIASISARTGRLAQALTLYGWADAERLRISDSRPTEEQIEVDKDMQKIHAELSGPALAAAEARGKALTREQAIGLAHQIKEMP